MIPLITDDRRIKARRTSDDRNEHYATVLILAFVLVSCLMFFLGVEVGHKGNEQRERIISTINK